MASLPEIKTSGKTQRPEPDKQWHHDPLMAWVVGKHMLCIHIPWGRGRAARVLTPSQEQEMSPCVHDRTKARTEISTKTEIHTKLPTHEISSIRTLPLTQGSEKETCHLLRIPGG